MTESPISNSTDLREQSAPNGHPAGINVPGASIDLRAACIHPMHELVLEGKLQHYPSPPLQIETLLGDLRSNEPRVRREAAEALSIFGRAAAAAVPVLIDQIRAPITRRLPVRHLQTLVHSLSEIGPQHEATCATLATEIGTPLVGAIARDGLVGMGSISIPHLIRALEHPRAAAQLNASSALRRLGAAAVAPLIETLTHQRPAVRCLAAEILGALGTTANAALPELRRCARSWRPSVRLAGRHAICQIEAAALEALDQPRSI